MKETIGLILQAISMICFLYVLNRQLNDLFLKEDDRKKQYTKNVLFAGMSAVFLLCSVGFIRLLHIATEGHSTPLLDDMTFWSNRVVFLAIGLSAYFLYKGNKRVV